jgi:hypothetical protein
MMIRSGLRLRNYIRFLLGCGALASNTKVEVIPATSLIINVDTYGSRHTITSTSTKGLRDTLQKLLSIGRGSLCIG